VRLYLKVYAAAKQSTLRSVLTLQYQSAAPVAFVAILSIHEGEVDR